ncbi:MAG: efflux transporter outer membrane subunit [Burkholderiaceae bacterium]|nr:efflux transporter outer membrane subunit [Burkholderiaceae bacterium]
MRTHAPLTSMTFVLAVVSAAVLMLGGCVNIPSIPAKNQLTEATSLRLADQTRTPEVASAWWQALADAKLDALVQRTLATNPDLQVAAARLDRASALAEGAGALGEPVTGVGIDATRQRYTEHGLVPKPIAGSVRTTANLQAGVSWDFDFFGRNQAQLQAALGTHRAAQAESEAAAIVLSTQVVRGYLALARLLDQGEHLNRLMALRERSAELIAQRVGAGLDTQIELRQAQTPLPELKRQQQALQEQISLLRHQLAALSAQPMEALDGLAPALPKLPAALSDAAQAPLGIDLLGRRPDVAAARWRVEAATQDVTAARAQFYPNLNLTAFVGFNAIGFDNLLKSGSLQGGFGPALRLPIFDSGRLRAQLHGNVAELDAAVAGYNARVLSAVHESADALSSVQSLAAQVQQQQQAMQSVASARELARQRQAAGLGNALTLIYADIALVNQQRALSEVQAQWLDSHVLLIKALGGGWQATAI